MYPVVVDEWQHECCGTPFQVGDEVRWLIELIDSRDAFLPEPYETAIDGTAAGLREVEPDCTELSIGSMRIGIHKSPSAVAFPLRGVLHQEHHGGLPENFPQSTGIVERVSILARTYTLTGEREWTPVADSTVLREVSASPTAFRRALLEGTEPRTLEDGLLVHLRIA